jgi:predicted phosphoribosyltransferase
MYLDRADAGLRLASLLASYRPVPNGIVLALPRGGVPVAVPVSLALGWPLDILIVRKLGVPGHEEYAMGAIASGGVRVTTSAFRELGLSSREFERTAQNELVELVRRESAYRERRPALRVDGRTAILVDDGLATGASMRAAVRAARGLGARRVVVAVPVGSAEACQALRSGPLAADDVVCASMPSPFIAVGAWYQDFTQVSDQEVIDALAAASRANAAERC